MKKEHGMLYSPAMVKAKLSGRKTVTRRIITPHNCVTSIAKKYLDWDHDNIFINGDLGIKLLNKQDGTLWRASCKWQPGDLLWGRETWGYFIHTHDLSPIYCYRADWNSEDEIKWKPSIHMPKDAARIWDEVVSVRAERLHEITEEDAIAEGIEFDVHTWGPIAFPDGTIDHCVDGKKTRAFKDYLRVNYYLVENPLGSYRSLWESINGPDSWEKNPLVWRIETKPYRQLKSTLV
jgi:hypothetical protein